MDYLDKILAYCEENHIKRTRFEREAGLPRGLISHWINKGHFPSYSSQKKVAAFMGITVNELMAGTYAEMGEVEGNLLPEQHVHTHTSAWTPAHSQGPVASYIPIYQYAPSQAAEEPAVLHTITIQDDEMTLPEGCFGFVMEDSSMAPEISAGDTVIIEPTDTPDPGDIVLAATPGESPILRRLVTDERGIILQPYSMHYDAVWYSREEMELLPVVFLGRAVRIQRTLRSASHIINEGSIL